ncbi:T9SS type A sorting domain-containing protein [Mariniflexile sp. AS56]|uniref:T9SS type A sorting domain-containing protein n=1 Tax=Mariniflexile sp. AS56 TaxID=3063957 RepID=UPI0026EE125B|nr:T9SS type A sorting domain-containing protein [Mariniflexile sp. AS56]MDO7172889.1 T9SS type A sorting domain-containing protein [Mariniflexile sp. AS56]
MKKITFLSILLCMLFAVTNSYSQKVAIIGLNHNSSNPNTDGFTFVALENLPNGEIIYFTHNDYDAAQNVFTFGIGTTGGGVVKFTATSAISKGTVIFVNETGTSTNMFTVSCCGTAIIAPLGGSNGNGGFAISSGGDGLYAYTDTNENVRDAIGEIYSVMYTIPGTIPANESPTPDHPNAIVVDGFTITPPDRTEYKYSGGERAASVSKVALENPTNYLNGLSNTALSTVTFSNINLSGSSPVLTVATSPTSVLENSSIGMVYTFTLASAATSPITVNFSVGGTATLTTDYTQTGATTFSASSGTVIIPNGGTTASITLTPVGDTTLEPNETAILTITAGTGYEGGSPSAATGTIANDDTDSTVPLVAITGLNHVSTAPALDGFSFVALSNIPGGTTIYFTENTYNNTTLTFSGVEGVVAYVTPSAGLVRGDVIVATETGTATNVFNITCNGTSGNACGTMSLVSGSFAIDTSGESFYAYSDTDTDPNNGVTAIYSLLYTGESGGPSGGNVPALQNPINIYTNVIVVDGFSNLAPNRTEYKFAGGERAIDVDQASFQNTNNWLFGQANTTLSTVPFNNIIITSGSSNPIASVTLSPNSVAEDSGTGMVYTFALSATAAADTTINYTVGGTATFPGDYGVSGTNTFNATTGSVTIPSGSSSATITVTPIADIAVEPLETVQIALASGTGYNGGSPNDAIGSITNDDTSNSDPLVAITGLSHDASALDAFSFVAIKDIPANTIIYFTEEEFDNTTLTFNSGGESVIQYTSPATVIPAGDVIVATETGTTTNVFNITCNGTSGNACGTMTLISGSFAIDTAGESFYAYSDNNSNPSDGVTDIYAVLYTGNSPNSGGLIPTSQDPSQIYLNALVVDGFPSTAPVRTEYDETKRNVLVTNADFENTANWLYAQANPPGLSPEPFSNLFIGNLPPTAVCQNITLPLDAMGQAVLTPTQINNGSTDDSGTVFLSFETMSFDGEFTASSPTDDLDGNLYPYHGSSFTVPTTGTYTFNMTGTTTMGNDLFMIIWDETPIPNSGVYLSRPEYFDNAIWSTSGALTTGTGIFNFVSGKTYYMTITALNTDTGTFSTTVDMPIRTTAANTTFNCVNTNNIINETLYTFDREGNTSSCASTVTITDSLAPVITCPADQTQTSALYTVPDYFGTAEAQATDNCTDPIVNTTQNPVAGTELTPGVYTVTIEAQDASSNINTCTFQLTVNAPLSITDNEFDLSSITMYPNPTASHIYLTNPKFISLKTATLYDMSGRLIETFDLRNVGDQTSINVSKLASATYILIIESEKGRITKRLNKE